MTNETHSKAVDEIFDQLIQDYQESSGSMALDKACVRAKAKLMLLLQDARIDGAKDATKKLYALHDKKKEIYGTTSKDINITGADLLAAYSDDSEGHRLRQTGQTYNPDIKKFV